MEQMDFTANEKDHVKRRILHEEAKGLRSKRRRLSAKDFESIKIIGRGAFGEVRVCRWKDNQQIVAIKKMKKEEMIYKNQVGHVTAERNVLALANQPWIVDLICSF